MNKKYFAEKLDFIAWEEEDVPDPDLITRIYPASIHWWKSKEDSGGAKETPFLTDRCYTLEELNEELDIFQRDIEDIRKRAKKKYDKFNTKKEVIYKRGQ